MGARLGGRRSVPMLRLCPRKLRGCRQGASPLEVSVSPSVKGARSHTISHRWCRARPVPGVRHCVPASFPLGPERCLGHPGFHRCTGSFMSGLPC